MVTNNNNKKSVQANGKYSLMDKESKNLYFVIVKKSLYKATIPKVSISVLSDFSGLSAVNPVTMTT